ncbi:MAG: Gfo/Idh/MocA family oxidoreductase [Deltaproteobacteria bacterium]|jgi:predicted dehydrogenase|nr:Gfo/Idh/MocA family oxidoreductase [Deltaproteobacteria bacterium]
MKAAVVGAGYWGPNLIRSLVSQRSLEGVVVCDKDPKRLELIKTRFPSVDVSTDLDHVLSDRAVEAVLIATPISTHGPLGKRALQAKKHVFIEKPLAGSKAEAEMLVELAERNDRVLMVGHTFEYSPPVQKTRAVIEAGDLGKIYFISMMRVNLGLHQRDMSVIWDLAPHDFSILFYWLRETPEMISAFGRDCVQKNIPDVAFINVRFPSGVIANLEVAWLAPSKLRRTAIVGEKKMLVYDDTENIEKVKIYDQGVNFKDPESFGEFQLSYRTGDIVSPRISSAEPLMNEMEHFLDCIRTGKTPSSDGRSGLRVVEALEAAETALKTGNPVHLSPKS